MALNVLIVEDSESDAELLVRQLRQAAFEPVCERVDTPQSMAEALKKDTWNLVLSDYSMPRFSAPEALKMLQASHLDIPFVLVTGCIGDEAAANIVKAGAHDYLLKSNLSRLPSVVGRALGDAEQRRIRRRRQDALTESHALLQAVTEGTTDAIFVKDHDGCYLMVNPAAAEMFGRSSAQIIGRCDADIFSEDIVKQITRNDREVMQSGETRHFEEQLWIDGELKIMHATKGPYRDSLGKVMGCIGISRDITARKKDEENKKYLAEVVGTVLDSLDYDSIVESLASLPVPPGATWHVIDLFEGAGEAQQVAITHRDPKLHQSAQALVRNPKPDNRPEPGAQRSENRVAIDVGAHAIAAALGCTQDALVAALGARSLISVPMLTRGRSFGTVFLVSEHKFCAADTAFAVEFARRLASAVDNALLYRQANESIRLRDDFLSVAAHELRTPLSALILQLQSLERQVSLGHQTLDTKARDKLTRAVRQTNRLARLIDGLLDVSRITAGRLQLDYQDFDLTEAVGDVAARMGEEATRAGCKIDIRADSPAPGSWDRLRVEQIVTNLLSNGFRYAPGTHIEVGVHATNDHVRISVADHGIGIDPKDLGRIFGRFERAAPVHNYGGLGLGLFITRQIAKAHGGEVSVESTLGQGTTFLVDLPRYPFVALPQQ